MTRIFMRSAKEPIRALPAGSSVPAQDYAEARRAAREWMARKGIHEPRSVYAPDPSPRPESPRDLTGAEVINLIDLRQAG